MHDTRSSILSGNAGAGRRGRGAGLGHVRISRRVPRTTDHRAEDRHRDLVEGVTILFRGRRSKVEMVNVSSRGAMIASRIKPRIGEIVKIAFAAKCRTRAAVRWARDGRIGVEFVGETIFWDATNTHAPVFRAAGADGRPEREARRGLVRLGTLFWSGISIEVELRNVSSGGAAIDSVRALRPGATVALDLGEAGVRVAEVRWSADGQIGLRFAEDFDLDSLAPLAGASDAEPHPDSPWTRLHRPAVAA